MLGLMLAATMATGQVDVGAYFGQGRTIYVQGEPYAYSEVEDYVEPDDSGSYPVYDFTDPGTARALLAGNGGMVVLNISPTGAPGNYAVDLILMPSSSTTGNLVMVSGDVTITFFAAADDEAVLEYTIPVFALFLRPRSDWTWSTPLFGGIPPGTYVTARFVGQGYGSAPSFWTCPGITTSTSIQ